MLFKLVIFNRDSMRKSAVIESISTLPDEFSIDEIIERLVVIEKIEKGRKQVSAGQVNTEEQAKAKLDKWLNWFPQTGRIVPEKNEENLRELIEGNYRIIYEIISADQINILTVYHSARDLKFQG